METETTTGTSETKVEVEETPWYRGTIAKAASAGSMLAWAGIGAVKGVKAIVGLFRSRKHEKSEASTETHTVEGGKAAQPEV